MGTLHRTGSRRLVTGIFALMLMLGTFAFAASTYAQDLPKPVREWTVEEKCEWLRDNFPQSTAGVKELAVDIVNGQNPDAPAIGPEQIRPTKYGECKNGGFDGFIQLGPQDGFDAVMRTLEIPPHGMIAGYQAPQDDPTACGDPGPKWTGETYAYAVGSDDPCDDTYVAFEGSFTGLSMSFFVWNDWDAPTSDYSFNKNYATSAGSSSADQDAGGTDQLGTASCNQPSANPMTATELADKNGWTYNGEPDAYGGLFVTYQGSGQVLPDCWALQGSYNEGSGTDMVATDYEIKHDDTGDDRAMLVGDDEIGYATVYPPCADREELSLDQC